MKIVSRTLLIMIFILFCITSDKISRAEVNFWFISDSVFYPGEELTYVVSYSLVKLGEVKIKVRDKKIVNGKTFYSTIAYMDSYSGVPFVTLHQTYESNVSDKQYTTFFRGVNKEKQPFTYTEYDFNYIQKEIKIKRGRFSPAKIWIDSSQALDKTYQDGLSLFFYARMNSGQSKSVDVPTFVNEKKEITKINFYKEVTDVSIDAVDYDIACTRLDGELDFISIFGLTGYFEGWFTNDDAKIPVVANMKVLIGNIRLELVKWKRENWQPPKFEE
jgi:hypothetical protein